jgi:hypothetical protein
MKEGEEQLEEVREHNAGICRNVRIDFNDLHVMRTTFNADFLPRGPHFKIEPIETELFCGPHLKFGSAVRRELCLMTMRERSRLRSLGMMRMMVAAAMMQV